MTVVSEAARRALCPLRRRLRPTDAERGIASVRLGAGDVFDHDKVQADWR